VEDSICTFLSWDSTFFGLRVARLAPTRLSRESLLEAMDWCRENRIDCLYFLADSAHAETIHLAEGAGFQFVDIRVTLTRPAGEVNAVDRDQRIRLFQDSDLESLKAIARVSHNDSRFFFDGRFDKERCAALFETWIERSCGGWAQAVFVAEVDGVASGYCTCHIEVPTGTIGLVSLAPQAQGRSLGLHLIAAAASYFGRQGVTQLKVVTQGRNIRAQRLYQKCGFVTDSVMLWYHKWLGNSRVNATDEGNELL
jgi:dTDP-4-amino-4,6-dideoxy-D-galactose acyltransferase